MLLSVLLSLTVAQADPIHELAEEASGGVLVAIDCTRASPVLEWSRVLDAQTGELQEVWNDTIDASAPFRLVYGVGSEGPAAWLDFGILPSVDDGVLSANLGAPFDSAADEEAPLVDSEASIDSGGGEGMADGIPETPFTWIRQGRRVKIRIPDGGKVGDPSDVDVVERLGEAPEGVCRVALDGGALPAGKGPKIGVLVAGLGAPGEPVRAAADVEMPEEGNFREMWGGEGSKKLPVARSRKTFPIAAQISVDLIGMLREGAARLLPEKQKAAVSGVFEGLPERIRTAPGLQVAMGGKEVGGAVVLPMARPRSPRRLTKLMTKGLQAFLHVEPVKIGRRLYEVPFPGRPPLHVGFARGAVVLAMHQDVVSDVLAGKGEPWMPAAHEDFGLRLRLDPDQPLIPKAGGFGGYLEARVEGDVVHVMWLPHMRDVE